MRRVLDIDVICTKVQIDHTGTIDKIGIERDEREDAKSGNKWWVTVKVSCTDWLDEYTR